MNTHLFVCKDMVYITTFYHCFLLKTVRNVRIRVGQEAGTYEANKDCAVKRIVGLTDLEAECYSAGRYIGFETEGETINLTTVTYKSGRRSLS